MLLLRSISIEVLLVLLIQQHNAQEEYGLEESEDHSDFTEDGGEYHEHPDYSKYYSLDGNAPLTAEENKGSGFVGSSEFTGFFAPQTIEYQETVKQPILSIPSSTFIPQGQQTQSLTRFAPIQSTPNFHFSEPLRDFFEESQKKQKAEEQGQLREDYIRPGPNYISHQIPLHQAVDEVKSASAEDVERIPPRPNKPKSSSGRGYDEGFTDVEGEIENEAEDEKYTVGLLSNSKTPIDYNIGKSSSTVSQFPAAAGYIKPSPGDLSPYQKYSFQPTTLESSLSSKYSDSLSNIDTSYNPNYEKLTKHSAAIESQPSEEISSHIKSGGCRKIAKPSHSSEDLNCFVCENAATKSKYTQCSYSSEKEPEEYSSGNSEKYSGPAKEINIRYRRNAANNDPYYQIRERSRKALDEPTIPADYNAGFQYEPEFYDETQKHLSYSEKQAEELKKDPKNCKKVDRKGMTCTICKNPETGGNYEQCSYTSEPKEKKYAYVKEKKYDSDDPEETKVSPQTEEAESSEQVSHKPEPEPTEEHEDRVQQKTPTKRNDEESTYDEKNSDAYYYPYASSKSTESKAEDDDSYDIPLHFADSVKSEKQRESNDEPSRSFDEYHARLFPELSEGESKRQDKSEYPTSAETRQNVEEVLAEFSKKDRTSCKKSEKNGMTCYLCVDKNGIQHEECMYVQESKPQSSHVAYHQLQGVKKLEDTESQPEESKEKPIVTLESKKNNFFKKPNSKTPFLVAAASEVSATEVPYEELKKHYKKKRSPKKSRNLKQDPEPTFVTPAEFKVQDEEGAFSEETKPVYSELHDENLPKYMVEKSEFEKEFDSSSGAL
ncbi:uncharacterized protein [Leptinotarsa decemlineata]|uniref:uncharacterized protein n=1 Tax=Leptinotarsa decemlineata TaxID=7539 RepID=UPI003D3084FB